MAKLRTHILMIIKYKEKELIAWGDCHAKTLEQCVPYANKWASEVLPDIKWGNPFRIPSNGVWCRRSVCRTYQQTIQQRGDV